jgi:hypothetical protein
LTRHAGQRRRQVVGSVPDGDAAAREAVGENTNMQPTASPAIASLQSLTNAGIDDDRACCCRPPWWSSWSKCLGPPIVAANDVAGAVALLLWWMPFKTGGAKPWLAWNSSNNTMVLLIVINPWNRPADPIGDDVWWAFDTVVLKCKDLPRRPWRTLGSKRRPDTNDKLWVLKPFFRYSVVVVVDLTDVLLITSAPTQNEEKHERIVVGSYRAKRLREGLPSS